MKSTLIFRHMKRHELLQPLRAFLLLPPYHAHYRQHVHPPPTNAYHVRPFTLASRLIASHADCPCHAAACCSYGRWFRGCADNIDVIDDGQPYYILRLSR